VCSTTDLLNVDPKPSRETAVNGVIAFLTKILSLEKILTALKPSHRFNNYKSAGCTYVVKLQN
jgi:hypothetical protein